MQKPPAILPFRQVHLDFHTSPHIPGVGADFDANAFADTLAEAHVNSITIFAKCHHGMAYYPTDAGVVHPSLKGDLLGPMIEACHKRGIRAPIYFSLGWDEHAADIHSDWMFRNQDGVAMRKPLEPGWRLLCFNAAYIDYVETMVREIVAKYPVDGLFFDIVFLAPCYCTKCVIDLQKAGKDPANPAHQHEFRVDITRRMMQRLNGVVHDAHPGATIYYNSIPNFAMRPFAEFQTQLEIECLPRGGWGYDFFPFCVRRMTGYSHPMLGMTGRFLESWGHFGSLSPQASVEYECFSALAHGAGCSIGDQLHPRGRLDPEVYQLIGNVYEQVEAREPWVAGSRALAEVALLTSVRPGSDYHGFSEGDLGLMRMLLEEHFQFEVLDGECDFTPFRVLILPDTLVDAALAKKINAYVDAGGKLVALGKAGMAPAKSRCSLPALGVDCVGESMYEPAYIVPSPALEQAHGKMPIVAYERGVVVRAQPNAEVLAYVGDPYFNRTWEHFCSHFHTPYEKTSSIPALVRTPNSSYFAHPLGTSYFKHGYLAYRALVVGEIDRLLGQRLVHTNAPHATRVTLLKQNERHVLHILYYVPERRTPRFEMVEDVIPLHDVALEIRLPQAPKRVYQAPDGNELTFQVLDGVVSLTVPKIQGHTMVVLE